MDHLFNQKIGFNEYGHTCWQTKRIAMTVAEAYARDDSPDRNFFVFNRQAEDLGLECWRLVDGIDSSTATVDGEPTSYELWYDNGGSKIVKPSYLVYMQRTKEEQNTPQPA